MLQSCDVGSLPFFGNLDAFMKGAKDYEAGLNDYLAVSFEKTVVKVFADKLAAGIDVPNFPQFRDMNEMFLNLISGVERLKDGYVETARLKLKPNQGVLPEILAIKRNANGLGELFGKPFALKVCITGPYTLASFFPYRTSQTFSMLGEVVARIVEANIFCEKNGCVRFVSVDEPVFGLIDDPLIDRGSNGRETLLKAWHGICSTAKAKGAVTCLHLHNTSDELFWAIKSLDVVESHVDDALYRMDETKRLLQLEDKILKASICITDFDKLIRNNLAKASPELRGLALDDALAESWRNIRKNLVAPDFFLESSDIMRKRAEQTIAKFGSNYVPYIGPECGMRGFPTYESALECLRRVASVAKELV